MHEAGVAFLDRRIDEAAAHRWTIPDLFGLHARARTIQPDFRGPIKPRAERGIGIDETASIGSRTFERNKLDRPYGAVAPWISAL